jgi:hypothetical protein
VLSSEFEYRTFQPVACRYIRLSKGKGYPITGHQWPRWRRGIALLILDLGARSGWVVSTTPQLFYPRERPGTHCTGGWVVPRACLDVCEKSRPTGIRSSDRPACSQSLYRLSYPVHIRLSRVINFVFLEEWKPIDTRNRGRPRKR